jgi:DNA modification methylase
MLVHEDCRDHFAAVGPKFYDAIITDPPFNVSEDDTTGGEKTIELTGRRDVARDLGGWDKGFDPIAFLDRATHALKPGGWLNVASSDKLWCSYYTVMKYVGQFTYKASGVWHITNPMTSVRKTTWVSSLIYWLAAVRGDGPPIAWKFIGQRDMHNFFEGPNCGGRERLYWHLLFPKYEGKKLVGGEIHPCVQPMLCNLCLARGKDDRHRHPAQKPIWFWEWFYSRITEPGMRVYDPYAGLGSSGKAARRYGLEWHGSELDWEFATVGQMWLAGEWHQRSNEQLSMLED